MLRRRIVSREDVLPTDSFILKQFFCLFHLDFHLSVDQSLTLLTQLAKYFEPLKYFEPELNLNPNRYLKRFDTLLLRLRRRFASREDVLPTDSFILKQFFRLFHLDFHLSVDQSLTLLTQLAYGTVIKGSGPCIFDLDPDLAT